VSRIWALVLVGLALLAGRGMAAASQTPREGDCKGCPASGKGSDPDLNNLKNRSSQASAPQPMTVSEVVQLPEPSGISRGEQSTDWPSDDLSVVSPLEAKGVVVKGYLAAMRQEGPEAVNCGRTDLHDFHTWIVASAGQHKPESFVAGLTPRWRAANSGWRLTTLNRLAGQHAKTCALTQIVYVAKAGA